MNKAITPQQATAALDKLHSLLDAPWDGAPEAMRVLKEFISQQAKIPTTAATETLPDWMK